jgi:hypothetical protein
MSGSELKTLAETIYDDTIDEVAFYQLLNVAKDNLEEQRPWEYLKAKDTTKSAGSGDTYLTMKALPADFRTMHKLYVGTDLYSAVMYEEAILYKDASWLYYLDMANNQFALCGANSGVITQIYIKSTPDIASASSPLFPARFHPILAFRVVSYIMAGSDSDSSYAKMSPENRLAAITLENSMIKWDANLKLGSMNHSTPIVGSGLPTFEQYLGKM